MITEGKSSRIDHGKVGIKLKKKPSNASECVAKRKGVVSSKNSESKGRRKQTIESKEK